MIKFIHKRHVHETKDSGKIVIYYNAADIFLGIILMALVAFFIHDYLSHALSTNESSCGAYMNQVYANLPENKVPVHVP